MQTHETVPCPFCGQDCTLSVETSLPRQDFTTDCEVCCRPFRVHVEAEDGEIICVEVDYQ